MHRTALFTLSFLLLGLGFLHTAYAQSSAQSIVQAAVDQQSTTFQTGTARMNITMTDKSGATKSREVLALSAKTPQGTRSLIRLLSPTEVQGQGFLFLQSKDPGKDDQVYSYLPAFNTTRRINGAQKNGLFMGTHFTYADLESRDIKEATYTSKKDEKIGSFDVYVIDATPKDPASSDYSKLTMYIRKSDNMTLKVKFFGKNKQLLKTLFVEKIDTQNGKKYVKQMTLRPADGGFSRMTIQSLDTTTPIPSNTFTPEALAKP